MDFVEVSLYSYDFITLLLQIHIEMVEQSLEVRLKCASRDNTYEAHFK